MPFDATPEVPIIRYEEIFHSTFTNEDVVKITFLFGDLLNKQSFGYFLSRETRENSIEKIKLLLGIILHQKNLNDFFKNDVLAEMLYLTKKFKALKELKTCRHQMKERFLKTGLYFSCEFRRFLLSICDELTEEDVTYLWSKVRLGSNDIKPIEAEVLFEWMLDKKQICPDNIDALSVHFQVMDRNDLLLILDKYKEKIGAAVTMSLYDLIPEPNGTCGLALIFNFDKFEEQPHRKYQDIALQKLSPRKGSDLDAEKLEKVWKNFGLKVERRDNMTRTGVEQILSHLLRQDLSSHKIFIICILSHGERGVFYCSDRVPIEIYVLERFLGTSSSLANKPKLLFIQACQGHYVQEKGLKQGNVAGSFEFDTNEATTNEVVVPQYSDMLIGMATVPGFMSIRSTREGTHYIQSLGSLLLEKGDKTDLSQLLVEVNREVMHKTAEMTHRGQKLLLLQMPTIRNQLTKGLIFKKVPVQGSGNRS